MRERESVCVCVCVCVCVVRVVPNKTVLFHISKNGDVSVCTSVLHSCTCILCENSDSVRNKNPKSLQVVLCVCTCVYVCSFMHMYTL